MRIVFALAALALTLPAAAQEGRDRVVGGTDAPAGAWPDVAGVVFGGRYVGCSGTLIAPQVVLTAAHCIRGTGVSSVVLNSTNWITGDEGEVIRVTRATAHPTADIGVLELETPATEPVRTIGSGCVTDRYLADDVDVAIVGFGLTSASSQFNSKLHEGGTTVVDADCRSSYLGCDRTLPAGSEVYAGGDGVDACSGDSGGPLYLPTEVGTYVIGATSRGPEGCRQGAIWVRPDAFIPWIEQTTGIVLDEPTCNFPPEVGNTQILVASGRKERVTLDVFDPDGDVTFDWTVVEGAEHGVVSVDEDGKVTYQSDDGYVGTDRFLIGASDVGVPVQTGLGEVAVDVHERGPLGCSGSGTAPFGWGALAAAAGLLVRRRRSA